MGSRAWGAVVITALVPALAAAADPPMEQSALGTPAAGAEVRANVPNGQSAGSEEQLEELERQLLDVLENVRKIRRTLAADAASPALTPDEAVEEFQVNPDCRVTVAVDIASAGWSFAPIPAGADHTSQIYAECDGRLTNGGTFSLLITPTAIREIEVVGLDLPPAQQSPGSANHERVDLLCKHLKGKRVVVTGAIRPSSSDDAVAHYSLIVNDGADVRISE